MFAAGHGSFHLRTLSTRPRVLLAEGVLKATELEAMRQLAEPRLERSRTEIDRSMWHSPVSNFLSNLGPWSSQPRPAHRTSSNAWLPATGPDNASHRSGGGGVSTWERKALAHVRAAASRIASLLRLNLNHSEPLQVVHYNVSQYYKFHLDNGGAGATSSSRARSRFVTALFYLNHGFGGGHTNFPLSGNPEFGESPLRAAGDVLTRFPTCDPSKGMSVRPKPGDVLLFYNKEPNSHTADFWPWHAACEVTSGEKWAANLFFHTAPLRAG